MLRDIEYFESRLGKIDGFEDASEYLTDIVKSKEVKSAATPADKPEEKQSSESSQSSESPATDTNNGTEQELVEAQVAAPEAGS